MNEHFPGNNQGGGSNEKVPEPVLTIEQKARKLILALHPDRNAGQSVRIDDRHAKDVVEDALETARNGDSSELDRLYAIYVAQNYKAPPSRPVQKKESARTNFQTQPKMPERPKFKKYQIENGTVEIDTSITRKEWLTVGMGLKGNEAKKGILRLRKIQPEFKGSIIIKCEGFTSSGDVLLYVRLPDDTKGRANADYIVKKLAWVLDNFEEPGK